MKGGATTINIFTKILVGILALLLWILPGSDSLNFFYNRASLDRNQVVADVVDAINTRNVGKLQAMMCLDIQENVADLPAEISNFYDAVLTLNGGPLTNYSIDIKKDVLAMSRPEFGRMQQDILTIVFYCNSKKYEIPVTWAICSKGPEAGIRRIALTNKTDFIAMNEIVATQYVA